MSRIPDTVNPEAPEFLDAAREMDGLCDALAARVAEIRAGGGEAAVGRHRGRGKLTVHERLARLLDAGSPFLECSQLAAEGVYETAVPAAGIVTGIGQVCGRPCVVVANDATVKGGTYYPLTVKKHLRAQEIALQNGLPCLYLVDSGGAFLPLQDEVFPDREHFGRIFYNQARLSAAGLAQIAVVLGSCTAGGAYVPAMADECIIVRDRGTIFLGGPPLVKAATGEEISAEELGGGDVHTRISGVADYLAEDEAHALALARRCVANLNRPAPPEPPQAAVPPRLPEKHLRGLAPLDPRKPLAIRQIIGRLTDDSRLDEFKPRFGETLVCGFAHWYGYPVGIIANDGVLFSEAAQKGAHFIQLCVRRGVPLVFLQHITGFMVGREAEHGGIARHGAKLVTAVACAPVAKYTVLLGGSFGAGNYAMCGRAYGGHFLWSWPSARISVMGGEQAAQVLSQIRTDTLAKDGKAWPDAEREAFIEQIRAQYETQGHPHYASARLWDDGVIDPLATRRVLGLALAANCAPYQARAGEFGIFRM